MNKFINWLVSIKAPVWVDPIRIVVGAFVFYKGIIFTNNFESFTENIASVGWFFIAAHLAHAILFIHLVGGILLTLGASTRLVSLANIPILAGAVVFNFINLLNVDNYMELELAIIALLLLTLVFFMGGGRYSLDYKRKQDEMKGIH